ncbi:hypothetical protein C8J56DRAFT_944330 [Mycena floridula]|nr:hypothetical protein C8J56DRAFT_944330 [Mycena floridula]
MCSENANNGPSPGCFSPENAESIRASIAAAVEEMDDCQAEIDRLENLLALAKAKREELRQSIEEREEVLRQFNSRRLPFELLAKIFTLLYEAETRADWIHAGISRTPFALATVCQFWRDVAVATPALWSTIRIRLDDCEASRMPDEIPSIDAERIAVQKLEMLDLFLQRSGRQASLKLFIVTLHSPDVNLLQLLAGYSFKVSHLDLEEMPDPFAALPLGFGAPIFNNLESLVIRTEWLNAPLGSGPVHQPFRWIRFSPKLAHLRLLQGAFHHLLDFGSRFWADLPRDNIEHLTVECCTPKSLGFFANFPRLVETRFQQIYYENILPPERRSDTIEAHRPLGPTTTPVRRLTISSRKPEESLKSIFDNVTSDNLEYLELSTFGSCELVRFPFYSFVAFAERSRLDASLTDLCLKGVRMSDNTDLISIFRLLPSITRLSLLELESFHTDGPRLIPTKL